MAAFNVVCFTGNLNSRASGKQTEASLNLTRSQITRKHSNFHMSVQSNLLVPHPNERQGAKKHKMSYSGSKHIHC